MFTATLLLLLSAAPLQADDAELARQLRGLLRKLDADQLAEREAAEKKIVALGPKVLDHLPTIDRFTPGEVKTRLERIIKAVETEAAEGLVKPSRVTLTGNMSLLDALDEMEQQTGNRVLGAENRDVPVDVDFDKTVYWEALDKILDQARLNLNPYGGQPNALSLQARPEGQADRSGKGSYASVFRFEPTRISSVRDLQNPQLQGTRLQLTVGWEPRVTPISLSFPIDKLTVTDDAGNDLSDLDRKGANLTSNVQHGISAIQMELPLRLANRGARRIASLKGEMEAMVPGRVATFEFAGLDAVKDKEVTQAGVTVTLQEVRKNLELYQVRINVRFDKASNALESHRGWILKNDAYVLAKNGAREESLGIEVTQAREENSVGLAYLFDLDGGPENFRFVYKTPGLIVKMPVEFELKDIPLP